MEFDKVGTLEAFNSDGLRSIIHTMSHIPNMKEKTLRYPGHVEYVRVLKESGFFGTEPMDVSGSMVTPLDFTCKVLFKEWELGEDEEEITVMRVSLKGENDAGETEESFTAYMMNTMQRQKPHPWPEQQDILLRQQPIFFWMAYSQKREFSHPSWWGNIKDASITF